MHMLAFPLLVFVPSPSLEAESVSLYYARENNKYRHAIKCYQSISYSQSPMKQGEKKKERADSVSHQLNVPLIYTRMALVRESYRSTRSLDTKGRGGVDDSRFLGPSFS